MGARDLFEGILADVRRVAVLEGRIEEAVNAATPHRQGTSSGGGGGAGDPYAALDAVIDSDAMGELERARGELAPRVERALDVLYGRSGRGGLAKARTSTDADILCCHYLQGMRWVDIARDITWTGSRWPDKWCRARAERALDAIDRIGMDVLADS